MRRCKATYDEEDDVWEGVCKGHVPTLLRLLARPTCVKNMIAPELWNAGAETKPRFRSSKSRSSSKGNRARRSLCRALV